MATAAHQIIDHPVDFHVVAGAEVEHHRSMGLAQQLGAGQGGDQRDLVALHQRQHRLDGGGTHVAEQGEHLVALNQLPGVAQGEGRLVTVIEAQQLQPPSMDAALTIHLREVGQGPFPIFLPEQGGGAAEGGRLPQHQLGRRWLGAGGEGAQGGQSRERQGQRESEDAHPRHWLMAAAQL